MQSFVQKNTFRKIHYDFPRWMIIIGVLYFVIKTLM